MKWPVGVSKASEVRACVLVVLSDAWPKALTVPLILGRVIGVSASVAYEQVRLLARRGLVEIVRRDPVLMVRLVPHPDLPAIRPQVAVPVDEQEPNCER
jgi:hypothetical protein